MIVDKATKADLAPMLEMGMMMHAESSYRDKSMSADKVGTLFWAGISETGDIFLRVVRKDGEIIGGMLGMLTPYWFSDTDLLAVDLALFVRQDKRGAIAAKKLIDAFADWARDHGAREVSLASSTEVAPERTAKLFEACGFPQIGTIHRRGI